MFKGLRQNKDLMYFIGNAPYKTLKALTVIFSDFAITWYLANYTSKELVGQYQFVLATMGLLVICSFPGIKDAIVQSVAKGYEYSLVKGTRFAIKFSLIGTGLILLMALYYYVFRDDGVLALTLFIVSLTFPFYYSLDNFAFFLTGKFKFKREFLSFLFIKIVLLILVFGSLYVFKVNVVTLISAYLFGHLITYFVLYLHCLQQVKQYQEDTDLIKYGWFITKINGVTQIANNFDKVIIGLFLSPSLLAIYSIGTSFPDKLRTIINPALTVFYPAFSKDRVVLNFKKIFVIFLFSLMIFFTTLVLLPFFINIFFSKYIESIGYGLLYALVLVFIPLNAVFSFYFRARKNRRGIRNPVWASRFTTIAILVPTLLAFGLTGVVVVRIIEQVTNLAFNLYYFMLKKYDETN